MLIPRMTNLGLPTTTISSCLVHKAYIPYNHTVFKAQGIIGERDRSRSREFCKGMMIMAATSYLPQRILTF